MDLLPNKGGTLVRGHREDGACEHLLCISFTDKPSRISDSGDQSKGMLEGRVSVGQGLRLENTQATLISTNPWTLMRCIHERPNSEAAYDHL